MLQTIKADFSPWVSLLDEFRPYNTDSAFAYCRHKGLASRTGNKEFMTNARLNTANVLSSIGMYKEAQKLRIQYPTTLCRIISAHITLYIKEQWLHIWWISQSEEDKMKYRADIRSDARTLLLDANTDICFLCSGHGRQNAIEWETAAKQWRFLKIFCWQLAFHTYESDLRKFSAHSYQILGDKEKQKRICWFHPSRIWRHLSARIYVTPPACSAALWGRRHRTMRKISSIAMSDAKKCNSRQRILWDKRHLSDCRFCLRKWNSTSEGNSRSLVSS